LAPVAVIALFSHCRGARRRRGAATGRGPWARSPGAEEAEADRQCLRRLIRMAAPRQLKTRADRASREAEKSKEKRRRALGGRGSRRPRLRFIHRRAEASGAEDRGPDTRFPGPKQGGPGGRALCVAARGPIRPADTAGRLETIDPDDTSRGFSRPPRLGSAMRSNSPLFWSRRTSRDSRGRPPTPRFAKEAQGAAAAALRPAIEDWRAKA